MLLELLVIIFTAVICASLGLMVLLRDKTSWTHVSFLFLTLIISFWTIANYFSLHSANSEITLFWIRVVMLITGYLGPTFLIFLHNFPNRKNTIRPVFLLMILVSTLTLSVLSFTPFFFSSVKIENGNINPQPGVLFPLYPLFNISMAVIGLTSLYRRFRQSRGVIRTQIRYLISGVSITIVVLLFTNLFSVIVLKTSALVFLGPVSSLIMFSFISYAILRHRFFSIRLIIVRSLTYTLLVIFLAVLYNVTVLSIANIVSTSDGTPETSSYSLLVSACAGVVITLTFPVLKNIVERGTEKIFYRKSYKPNIFLQEMSRIISSNIILENLLSTFIQHLEEKMKITSSSALLFYKQNYLFFSAQHYIPSSSFKVREEYKELLETAFIQKKEKILVRDEMKESRNKNLMHELQVAVVLPLIMKDELVGGLFIGEHSSGEAYDTGDINILEILAPQLALAIKNALSYEEIRQFSNTLQIEVERATVKLRRANERLKQLDSLKDEFVSVASHELRTPMTAVKSYLWLAMNGTQESLDATTKGYLTVAYNSTERLIRLVQEMLTISRIEGKHLELHKVMFDFADLVGNLYEELKIKAKEKNITFQLVKPKGSLIVEGDTTRLQEVVQNLFSNALKFTPQDGSVTVSLGKQDSFVFLKVQDSGPGILQEDVPKLFQKFSKIERSYVGNSDPGTGLGLFICQQIVKLHQGKIEVESEVGKGSVFTVKLRAKATTKNKKGS